MGYCCFFLVVLISWVFFIKSTHELQTSQTEVLLQLRKHLEYPLGLEIWGNFNGDFCALSSTRHVSITCQDDTVTQLSIMGDKLVKVSDFKGFAIPNQTLSERFLIDSFFTTLTRLTSLKVLCLVSLGIWGPLPDKVHRLSSLEILDLSSNFIFGSIPPQISRLVKLQTLILDGNYFDGVVPDSLDSLTNLTSLSLKSNRLKGSFPSSVCRITTLSDIALSHNQLSGQLPDLSNLTGLHVLDVRENRLDSKLPLMPKGIVTALLSKNSFSGEIPEHYGKLVQLQHLDVSFNHLTGRPFSGLFSLPNVSYLNLASNTLSGSLPVDLRCGTKLGFVDISANKFIGRLPSCLDGNLGGRVAKFGWNCLSISDKEQHQPSYCKAFNTKSKQSKGRIVGVIVAIVVGAVLSLGLLAFGCFALCRNHSSKKTLEVYMPPKFVRDSTPNGVSSEILANARLISQAAKLGTQGALVGQLFSFEELKDATNNFDSLMFMGEGQNGKLYKGRLENGTCVAIRSLVFLKKHSVQNLKVRIETLLKLHHQHLVLLLGYCIESGRPDDSSASKAFLVYEYVPNGSYRTYLSEHHTEQVLNWSGRLAILIGVAKAVHFLHTGVIPGSFGNRLKTNNILLDEHRIAKLSDYGMAVITGEHEKFEARGEGLKSSQMVKHEDDVYNFGFILLESLVGPIVSGKGEAFLLNEMTSFGSQDGRKRIVDPVVLTTSSQESLSIVVSITNKCVSPDPSLRPPFEDVLWNLQYAAQVQATADADQKSDSTS